MAKLSPKVSAGWALGKVIGTRTWGGEIWLSGSNRLADKGIATAAEIGVFGPEGKWLIEGHGVDPDIVVDNLPHATFEGRTHSWRRGSQPVRDRSRLHWRPPAAPPGVVDPRSTLRARSSGSGPWRVRTMGIAPVVVPLQVIAYATTWRLPCPPSPQTPTTVPVPDPVPLDSPERPVRSVTTAPAGFEGEGFPVRRAFAGVDLRRPRPVHPHGPDGRGRLRAGRAPGHRLAPPPRVRDRHLHDRRHVPAPGLPRRRRR